MTIPDVRDIPIDEDILDAADASIESYKKNKRIDYTPYGYACATIICITMLLVDGTIALTTAAAVAGTMAGLTTAIRRDNKNDS